jgi:hypothetical protein
MSGELEWQASVHRSSLVDFEVSYLPKGKTMGRKWTNAKPSDPAGGRNMCGCVASRPHGCEAPPPKPDRRSSDVAAWVIREMERLEGPDRARFRRSLGSLGRTLN